MKKTGRKDILEYAYETFGAVPEYPWVSSPKNAVLRHVGNRKWFAIIMEVSRSALGLSGDGLVDVMNVKCNPEIVSFLQMKEGYLPAYHMNKSHWISILLGGAVEAEEIKNLLEMSYEMTR